MTAKEYYNNQDRFEYFTKLTNTGISDDFDEIMAFAEAYHEHKLKLLGIANVVGQSEQLKCEKCGAKFVPHLMKPLTICDKCADSFAF